jgi:hypothetical protein
MRSENPVGAKLARRDQARPRLAAVRWVEVLALPVAQAMAEGTAVVAATAETRPCDRSSKFSMPATKLVRHRLA